MKQDLPALVDRDNRGKVFLYCKPADNVIGELFDNVSSIERTEYMKQPRP